MSNPSRVNPCVYELSLVDRVPLPHRPFDFEWMPDTLAIPSDFTQTMLAGLRGTATRDAVVKALAEKTLRVAERIRRTPELRPGQLPPFADRDPKRMAGLYLRPLQEDEVELARLEWRGTDATVISIRARGEGAMFRLSIEDEEGTGFKPPTQEPMLIPELGELLDVIGKARLGTNRVSLLRVLRQRIKSSDPAHRVICKDPEKSLLRVSSAYYPMLSEFISLYLAEQEEMLRVMQLERATPVGERCPLAVRGEWDPLRISAWVNRELASSSLDAMLAALSHYEDAIGCYSSARAAFWLHVGMACERAGQFEAAVAAYARGREKGSRQLDQIYWLHNNAGYSLNQLGRHDEALSLLAVAVDQAPLPHNAWKNLGVAWQALGRLEAAAVAYARAIATTPEDRRALALLEDLLLAHQDQKLHELPELESLRGFVQGLADESH